MSASTFYLVTGTPSEPKPNTWIQAAHTTLALTAFPYTIEGLLNTSTSGTVGHLDFGHGATISHFAIGRFISTPIIGQTITSQTITCNIAGFEDVRTSNSEWEVEVYVWGSNDLVRGTLGHTAGGFTEMNADEETETSSSFSSTQVICQDGDKLYTEILYSVTAAKAEVLSRLHIGPLDVSTYTSRIVFTNPVILTSPKDKLIQIKHGLKGQVSSLLSSIWSVVVGLQSITRQYSSVHNLKTMVVSLIRTPYSIKEFISALLRSIYSNTSRVLKILNIKFNVNILISQLIRNLYSLKSSINNILTSKFKLNVIISKILIFKYNIGAVLETVTRALSSLFSIYSRVLNGLNIKSNIRNIVSRIVANFHSLKNIVFRPLSFPYQLRTLVSQVLKFISNIKSLVIVFRSSIYSIIGRVSRILSLKYLILTLVTRRHTLKHSLRILVNKIFSPTWQIRTLISRPLQILHSTFGTVFRYINTKWNLRENISISMKSLHSILTILSRSITLNIKYMIGKLLEVIISPGARIIRGIPFKKIYPAIGILEKVSTLKINLKGSIQNIFQKSIGIKGSVSSSLSYVIGASSKILKAHLITYPIKGRILKRALYTIEMKGIKSFKYLNKLLDLLFEEELEEDSKI